MKSSDRNKSKILDSNIGGDSRAGGKLASESLTRKMTDELDLAAASIDTSTVRRLASARRDALEQSSSLRSHHFPGKSWVPAAVGLVVLVSVALLVSEPMKKEAGLAVTDGTQSTLESLPILSATEDLEFFQSVDFLIWMEKNSG